MKIRKQHQHKNFRPSKVTSPLFTSGIALTLTLLLSFASAAPAFPRGFTLLQPDGVETPELFLHGDHAFHFLRDAEAFPVIRDEREWYVYAEQLLKSHQYDQKEKGNNKKHSSPSRRGFLSSGIKVGHVHDPSSHGLRRMVLNSEVLQSQKCRGKKAQEPEISSSSLPTRSNGRHLKKMARRQVATTTGQLRNLVVPIRFSNHRNRALPTREDIDILFNSQGGDFNLAPTGSVYDVFAVNSYGMLTIDSTVLPWVFLSKTERYYADNDSGFTDVLIEAFREALDSIEQTMPEFDFLQYDEDGDGMIDGITFLVFGYTAEWGGRDCMTGADMYDRIWSHQWTVTQDISWKSQRNEIYMGPYVVTSALWDTCGSQITRVASISHELGHVLGLDDLYDGGDDEGGGGVGSFDFMSNMWGIDLSGLNPPILSPWSKIQLGWLKPTIITQNGWYQLPASADTPQVFRVDEGFPYGEYLLIENRQPMSFDAMLGNGGLAIWHIDEKAPRQRRRGYPGQKGWPGNGNHYRVALCQADKKYHLEKVVNWGNSSDLWELGEFGPGAGTYYTDLFATYPNTDSYRSGAIQKTGIRISQISASGPVASFHLSAPTFLPQDTSPPTESPTINPSSFPTRRPSSVRSMSSPINSPSKEPRSHQGQMHGLSASPTLITSSPNSAIEPLEAFWMQPTSTTPTNFPIADPSSVIMILPSITPTPVPLKLLSTETPAMFPSLPRREDSEGVMPVPIFTALPSSVPSRQTSWTSSNHPVSLDVAVPSREPSHQTSWAPSYHPVPRASTPPSSLPSPQINLAHLDHPSTIPSYYSPQTTAGLPSIHPTKVTAEPTFTPSNHPTTTKKPSYRYTNLTLPSLRPSTVRTKSPSPVPSSTKQTRAFSRNQTSDLAAKVPTPEDSPSWPDSFEEVIISPLSGASSMGMIRGHLVTLLGGSVVPMILCLFLFGE